MDIAISISDTLPIIERCERETYDDDAIAEGSFYLIDKEQQGRRVFS